ncbi:MAG TPA: SAM-dependent methyltransferase [Cyanobacteria bacterium UBA8543]|nr:SAM-dependent methyltransferase [Cyanobacteria bacterium UBA8543]
MKDIFFCPEESKFYSHCLETLVLNGCRNSESLIEFGSGDGSPVINALLRTRFHGLIHGFELNNSACKSANLIIEEYNLCDKYVIHNQSFFDASKAEAEYLVSNPPYLPAPDDDIYLPALRGGNDGSTLTKQLLSLDYENVLLMISSFSDPEGTINHAREKGYYIADFVVVPLPFGYYSSEPKVKNTIKELQKKQKAFYSEQIYFLAGVLFKKADKSSTDLSSELVKVMTAL